MILTIFDNCWQFFQQFLTISDTFWQFLQLLQILRYCQFFTIFTICTTLKHLTFSDILTTIMSETVQHLQSLHRFFHLIKSKIRSAADLVGYVLVQCIYNRFVKLDLWQRCCVPAAISPNWGVVWNKKLQ